MPATHPQVISTNWPDPDMSAAGRVTAGRLQMLQEWMGAEAHVERLHGNIQLEVPKKDDMQDPKIEI